MPTRGSHHANEKLYDPRWLYQASSWDTSREIMWAQPGTLEAPLYPTDWTRVPGCQVALSRVIKTPLPPEAARWWTITAHASQVVRNFPNGGTVFPLNDTDVERGVKSTSVQLAVNVRGEEIYVDIGTGTEFSLLAGNIDVGLFVPSTLVRSPVDRRPNAGAVGSNGLVLPEQFDGVVYDTSISLNFTASTAPESTHLSPTVTRSYDPAGTDIPAIGPVANSVAGQPGDYRIPPRARRVRFSIGQEGTVPAANVGVQFLSDQSSRIDRGELSNWAGPGERFSPWVDIPQNASIIDISEIEAPIVTATWELKL